jgi:hypothetical protein
MRIALFTPYSPEMGGGSVQLRSHLAQLPELNVEWYYLAPSAVPGERRHCLGKPLSSAQLIWDFAARSGFFPGSTATVRGIVDKLDADLYWVVAHYEGISVAAELLARGKAVHLTVHDDPVAMLIRSRRFRVLLPIVPRIFSRVLRGAKSVDVTSAGMRDLFKQKYGVNCFTLYKYVPWLPQMKFQLADSMLTVGHIGSLYHPEPFRKFVLAARDYANQHGRTLKVVRVGASPEMDRVAAEGLAAFENYAELLEQDALPVLATCDFVYAMYPHGYRFQGFRRTSLPIKLSTYIQAQRPIFAHTPTDSGLARLVSRFNVGQVCPAQNVPEIRDSIQLLMNSRIACENFEALRNDLMGLKQLVLLERALQPAEGG